MSKAAHNVPEMGSIWILQCSGRTGRRPLHRVRSGNEKRERLRVPSVISLHNSAYIIFNTFTMT